MAIINLHGNNIVLMIKFLDIYKQDKNLHKQILKNIKKLFKVGDFILGKEVDKFEISLKSENLVKNIFVDTDSKHNFSDNYFDMIPGKEYKISIKKDLNSRISELKSKIKLLSLYDTY